MNLVILGSGGFVPTDGAETACYMIPDYGIILDAGSGLYRIADYLKTDRLDIFLSHSHGDHTWGLPHLFPAAFRWRYADLQEDDYVHGLDGAWDYAESFQSRCSVHCTERVLETVRHRYPRFSGDWRILRDPLPLPDRGMLSRFPLHAGGEETGFRLQWPRHSLAYVTDTIASRDAPYIESIRGVDLLLHDCNLPEDRTLLADRIGHSHTRAVLELAAAADVGRLLMIHKNPMDWSLREDLSKYGEIFPNVEVAIDHMEITF